MKKITLLIIILFIIFTFFLFKNSNEEKIKIGFIAGLSGKYSSLGHDVLNGFSLAFEEINYKINNKNISLIIKDDAQEEEKARKSINDLIHANIKLIVGNCTSSMTKISLDSLKRYNDTLLISATTSSDEFSKIDDNFIRTQVANNWKKFLALTKYIKAKSYKRFYLIYDSKNATYANGMIRNLKDAFFIKKVGKIVQTRDLNEGFEHFSKDLEKLKDIDSIIIIANSIDTGKTAQYLRLEGINKPLIASGWSKDMSLITEGSKAVEGIVFNTGYDDNSESQKYKNFVKNYKNKYNTMPSVFAAQSYETAQVLISSLKKNKKIENLKDEILKIKVFDGLQGKIVFDRYGDVQREYFIMSIKDGKYVRLKNYEKHKK